MEKPNSHHYVFLIFHTYSQKLVRDAYAYFQSEYVSTTAQEATSTLTLFHKLVTLEDSFYIYRGSGSPSTSPTMLHRRVSTVAWNEPNTGSRKGVLMFYAATV